MPINGDVPDYLLSDFTTWYKLIRPHQHLHGYTPAEAWTGVAPYAAAPKFVQHFSAWDGLLTGYLQR